MYTNLKFGLCLNAGRREPEGEVGSSDIRAVRLL